MTNNFINRYYNSTSIKDGAGPNNSASPYSETLATAYGKGYAFPRPLISKLSIISALQNKFQFIGLTLDLFQNYPDLFKTTSTNLLYLLQTGTSYKKDAILALFETMFNASNELTINEANKLLNNDTNKKDEIRYLETQSIMILYAYYMWHNNDVKFFEPAMKPIYNSLETFLNNPEVYYGGTKYHYRLFKPLCYNNSGDNLFDFIPYFCYVMTLYGDGQPYKFFEEIGSETSYNNLLVSIDNYFAGFYRNFMKQIGMNDYLSANFNDFPIFIDTIFEHRDEDGKKLVFDKLQQTLDTMLNMQSLLELRNNEMNKSANLLDDNFNDQNRLSDAFLDDCFKENMDKLIKVVVEKNPIMNLINQFPKFKPLQIGTPFENYSLNELMWMTQYCLSGGDKPFCINEDYNYLPLNSDSKVTKDRKINTKIERFINSIGTPFSDCDVALQMLTAFIKKRIITQQENFLDTPDLQNNWVSNETISITADDFKNEELSDELSNLYLESSWALVNNEIMIILESLAKYNIKFKEDIDNILNLHIICGMVYTNILASKSIGVLLMSYLKELLITDLYNKLNTSSELTLNNFNFYNYLMKYIVPANDNEIQKRITKISNMLISLVFINNDAYCRYINICMKDFSKYINMKSFVQMPYIKGNNDDCDIFAIGGRALYDKMVDPNPLNRGYYFMLQTTGINGDIEVVYRWTKDIKDKNTFDMLNGATSENTVLDILDVWFRSKQQDPPMLLRNFEFQNTGSNLNVTYRMNNYWSIWKTKFNDKTMSVPMLLLSLSFKQVTGSYIDNVFMSKQFIPTDKLVLMPGATSSRGFVFTNNLSREVAMLQDQYSKYTIPLYKYQSDLVATDLQFVNPSGYNLIQIVVDSSINPNNNVLFLFTNTVLDNGYNFYTI